MCRHAFNREFIKCRVSAGHSTRGLITDLHERNYDAVFEGQNNTPDGELLRFEVCKCCASELHGY
jgi:hypothetical protein